MKIVVFGATGGTGKELVKQGLEMGHTVTAFVRDPVVLTPPGGLQPGLRLAKGDVFDAVSVSEAIAGQDAVLSALGARTIWKEGVLKRALPNVLRGMDEHGVQRIIVLGAAGALYPAGKYQTGWFNLGMALIKTTLLRQPFADQATQERLLEQSSLNYTIVRPPRLTDESVPQEVRVLPDGLPGGGWKISRADLADFMLLQLTDPRFHRQGVYISY